MKYPSSRHSRVHWIDYKHLSLAGKWDALSNMRWGKEANTNLSRVFTSLICFTLGAIKIALMIKFWLNYLSERLIFLQKA